MLGDRIFRTFILAALGLALMGLVRPSSPDPTEDVITRQSGFFINKAHQQNQFDMVIVGDSRALRGLSPAEISNHLPGVSVFNFAFNAGGMNPEMYREAEALLNPESVRKTIILVPTSLAFLEEKTNNAQFREYRMKARDQVWLYRQIPTMANFFQPLSPSVYLRRWLHVKPLRVLTQDFQSDGWIATDQSPLDDVTNLATQYKILASRGADQALIDDFMTQTRQWTANGISVFSLYPPAYEPRAALEDSLLGFDRNKFRKAFENAGGIWLDVNGPDYVSYDGSHLVRESAVELSRVTGLALAAQLRPAD